MSTVRLSAEERREQLLSVALEIFGIGGYGEASMAEIASAAGITKPVVYQHFPSKRALFLELLDECGRLLEEAIVSATSDTQTPRERVDRGFGAFVAFFEDNPAMFRVLFSDASRSDPEFARRLRSTEDVLADRIASLIDTDALASEERAVLARGVIGMAEAACGLWVSGDSSVPPSRVGELLAELAWAGLRGDRSGS